MEVTGKSELHLIVVWERGRVKENEIREDIARHFRIVKCYEIVWTRDLVANNFTRFYGVNLPPDSFKEVECGTGPFLLYVVYDDSPVYAERQTSRGLEMVNTNLFDAKMRYREWTGGGHKIHATNNCWETNHDLTLLLGLNVEDFIRHQKADTSVEILRQDLVGAKGWNNLEQLFYVLNNTVEYVILRGKQEVITGVFPDNHRDVDIFLTRQNHVSAVYIINGKASCSTERPHEMVTIDGYDYYLDLWEMERYYFDWRWSLQMLKRRKLEKGVYVLDACDDFYALLYHCLIYKGGIAPDYRLLLESYRTQLGIAVSNWHEVLRDFIQENGYMVTVPTDKSVKVHADGTLFGIVEKYGQPVKYLHSSVNDKVEFESAVYEKNGNFVKVGTPFLIDNEVRFLEELSAYSCFPNIVSYSREQAGKHVMEISRVDGVDALSFFSLPEHHSLTMIQSFIRQCLAILLILNKHQVVHRDLTPSNILVSDAGNGKCKVGVIDFGWAIKTTETSDCVCPEGLGNEYASPKGCSDIYSFAVILEKLAFPNICYVKKIRSGLATLIEKNERSGQEEVGQALKRLKGQVLHYKDLKELPATGWSSEYVGWHLKVALFFSGFFDKKLIPKFIRHAFDKTYTMLLISKSGLFDAEWYKKEYPEVRKYRKSPLAHYLKQGFRYGYDPSERFSTQLYVKAHPEVEAKGQNPLVHYLKEGKKTGAQIYKHIDKVELNRQWLETHKPYVSVIVPNYNHAPYLRKRLDTIYQQTYSHFEVILMDDLSSDESVAILREYAERYPDRTRLFLNESNSGSPFFQWRKGIEAAKGDYIWIAESDDWCDADFLEKLLPCFSDEAVMLSFARSTFMEGDKAVWTIEEYLHSLNKDMFHHSFVISAHLCVKSFFSKRNIIPNVSSCIFRRPVEFPLFENNQWCRMKVCGDWIFYLYLIRGGYVAYNTDTTNYYRQHSGNTSVSLHSKASYYEEHQMVREHLARLYALNKEELCWMVNDLRTFWQKNSADKSMDSFDKIFQSEEIGGMCQSRLPNVAVCGFAFSTGGGEKVPIDQANGLMKAGCAVTFIDCVGAQRNNAIRKKLHPNIPVVVLDWNFSKVFSVLNDIGAEIVHTHHASVDYAIALNKPKAVRQFVTLHGMYETIKPQYLKAQAPVLNEQVEQWLYIADKNLAVMKEYGIGKDNFKKIFNAVPKVEPRKTREAVCDECHFPKDCIILCIASRALPEKGWNDAYDAVKHLRMQLKKDIRIIFVGDGPVYEERRYEHVDWAYFAGYSDDVASYFNASEVVLLPSVYTGESFPLCILEAFQMGKPVVATDIGEIRTMLDTPDGIAGRVIPINASVKIDAGVLEQAISELICNEEEYRRAVAAAHSAAAKYSVDELIQLLLSLYSPKDI